MTQPTENQGIGANTGNVADLFRRYLSERTLAQAAGLGFAASAGEVEPFDAGPVQPVDPQLAWRGAQAAATHFFTRPKVWPLPNDWSSLVGAHEPAVALAFCLGNYPQMVREIQPLLRQRDRAKLRPTARPPLPLPGLVAWATQPSNEPERNLISAAALRLAHHYDEAAKVLARVEAEPWQALRDNELASLDWHQGRAEQADEIWQRLPESVPVLFNRGMAALFLGRASEAEPLLTRAVDRIHDGDPWHHLGLLYRILAVS